MTKFVYTFADKDAIKGIDWKKVTMIVAWTTAKEVFKEGIDNQCKDCKKDIWDDPTLPKEIDRVCKDCLKERLWNART